MKLRDIFTEAFWKARWKETLDAFGEYGRAATGQPPLSMTPDPRDEQPKPEPEKRPPPPAGPTA